MNHEPAAGPVDKPLQAPLIDVSSLQLFPLDPSVVDELARSLRQVISSLDDPNGVISAFQSFASDA